MLVRSLESTRNPSMVRLDMGKKLHEETQQLAPNVQIDAQHLGLALIQDRRLGVLKDDVVERVPLRFLFLDLMIEIVVSILRFPIGAREAVSVAYGSIGNEPLASHGQKRDENPSALLCQCRQKVFESRTDRTFMLDPLLPVLVKQRILLIEGRVVRLDRFPR